MLESTSCCRKWRQPHCLSRELYRKATKSRCLCLIGRGRHQLARLFSSRMLVSQIDAKKELEKSLKATCEGFIMAIKKLVVDHGYMLSFVTKILELCATEVEKYGFLSCSCCSRYFVFDCVCMCSDGRDQEFGRMCIICHYVTAIKGAPSSANQGQKSDSVLAEPLESQSFASPDKVAEVVQKGCN